MREEQIFHEVLEQAAEKRTAFLADACGADVELRQRVECCERANPVAFSGRLPAIVADRRPGPVNAGTQSARKFCSRSVRGMSRLRRADRSVRRKVASDQAGHGYPHL